MKTLKICLDPGHYAGANKGVVPGYSEGIMSFDLANRLRDALMEYSGVQVTVTRSSGSDLSLAKRGQMAKGCDLFLSLHSDAATGSPNAKGASIIRSLQLPASVHLARKLVAASAGAIGSGFHYTADGVWTRAYPLTKNTDYYQVIREAVKAGCPMVFLLENGFHTNQYDCEFLDKAVNRQKLAEALASTIAQYYGLTEPQKEVNKPELYRFVTGSMTKGDARKFRMALQGLERETGVGYTESVEQ